MILNKLYKVQIFRTNKFLNLINFHFNVYLLSAKYRPRNTEQIQIQTQIQIQKQIQIMKM